MKIVLLVVFVAVAHAQECQNGKQLIKIGMDDQARLDIVKFHNDVRAQIMDGKLDGQPQGVGLKTMQYDMALESEARNVSLQCAMEHVKASDPRWSYVGQNLHIEWNSEDDDSIVMKGAIDDWMAEAQHFIYPNQNDGETTGHYTQVVWADSEYIGCDFVMFKDDDPAVADYPYTKLYSCNYGPGGNIGDNAPYQEANN